MGRVAERAGFSVPVRLRLLETDGDDNDNELAAIRAQLGKVLWALVGLLISLTTASVLLGLNLAVGK